MFSTLIFIHPVIWFFFQQQHLIVPCTDNHLSNSYSIYSPQVLLTVAANCSCRELVSTFNCAASGHVSLLPWAGSLGLRGVLLLFTIRLSPHGKKKKKKMVRGWLVSMLPSVDISATQYTDIFDIMSTLIPSCSVLAYFTCTGIRQN